MSDEIIDIPQSGGKAGDLFRELSALPEGKCKIMDISRSAASGLAILAMRRNKRLRTKKIPQGKAFWLVDPPHSGSSRRKSK